MTLDANAATTSSSSLLQYRIDPAQSRLMVHAFAEGLLSAFGHDPVFKVRNWSGELQFEPETLEAAAVKVAVKADSLAVVNEVKEKDRLEIERTLRQEVLETNKYPEVTLTSTRVTLARIADKRYRATVIGDLTLHGVTQRNLWISGELTIGESDLRVKGEFTLKQKDYGIKLVSVAGGTLKVKNEVKCSFDVLAVRHSPSAA